MPVIQVDDQRYSLKPGQTRLGGGGGVDVAVAGDDALGVQAIVEVGAANQVVIRRATADATVRVNGVLLGAEPTPLIHGDKVEIAGRELRFADDAKAGATQFVGGADVAALVQKRVGAGRATAATGGRLISLVDGKEYTIGEGGISIGRDATCGIVVPQTEVSRKHAEVLAAENGYVVHDRSTNGVYVNGERIQGSRLLARADVVRVGSEEFRFYADVAAPVAAPRPAETPAVAAPSVAVAATAPTEPVPSPMPSPVPAPTPIPVPEPRPPERPAPERPPAERPAAVVAGAATPASRPVLATLEVTNEGIAKGTRHEIRVPLAHVGRGAHNDVVIADESVSESHAKLQRRDDGWYVVDLGSTNGTYVAGARVVGEQRLDGVPDVRFGGVKMVFRGGVSASPHDDAKGTRMIAGMGAGRLREPSSAPRTREPSSAPRAPIAPEPEARPGLPTWIWVAVAVAIAAAAYFAFRG